MATTRIAQPANVSIPVKVGTTTTAATTQGFIAARDREFGSADAATAPVIAWRPKR